MVFGSNHNTGVNVIAYNWQRRHPGITSPTVCGLFTRIDSKR
jgi:hypothetical protein